MFSASRPRHFSPHHRGQRARLMWNLCVAGVPLKRITCSRPTLSMIAAEHAFPKDGLHGVMRQDVAPKVRVRTLLSRYDFVDPRRPLEVVFSRRCGTSSSRSVEALEHYERGCGSASIAERALREVLAISGLAATTQRRSM
ncbi:MAG: hypothetical protein ACYCT1_05920 [Steroidobacteraceae bacterium]